MSKVLGSVLKIVGVFTGQPWLLALGTASDVYTARSEERRQRQRARDEYNASLKDRLEMVDITPDAPRTLVLGRVRAVEGVRRKWVSGTNSEKLTMVVSFAGHEIDGFEQWYLDDKLVTLDANGWVQEAPYAKTSHLTDELVFTPTGATQTVVLAHPALAGSVAATWFTAGENGDNGAVVVDSVAGTSVALSGMPTAGQQVRVTYQHASTQSKVRIRPWLGAPGQNVGAALAAEYPGKLSATDRFEGMALAVMDVEYDPDVFPQGRPNLTAVMRGARCLDPRTGTTYWSENPALHAMHYALWAHGYALPIGEVATGDVADAATVCDQVQAFTLRRADGSTYVLNLPRYRCGIVCSSDADPASVMEDILATMAGRDGWAGAVWRLRAGVRKAPVFTLTADWLALPAQDVQAPAREPVFSASNATPPDQQINRVTGSCVDPEQRWQVLPFPAVSDSVLIARHGVQPTELRLAGVTSIAHAQHLASLYIRQAMAPLRITARCNLRAWLCELFDVGTLVLPRYGMTAELAKTAEVVGWHWHPQAGVRLQLAEIAEAMFTPLAELTGRDPAPDLVLPEVGQVEQLAITGITSGTAPLSDGSILTRTLVQWGAAVAQAVRVGGRVEVQYIEQAAAAASATWASWEEAGSATSATIPGLRAGQWYLFRVRAVKPMYGLAGPWSVQKAHKVAAPPQVVTNLVDAGSWLVGTSGTQGSAPRRWVAVGDAGEDSIVLGQAPDGALAPMWQASSGDAVGASADGGWNTDPVAVDSRKQYRFSVWVVPSGTMDGYYYLGCGANTVHALGGGLDSNPYFVYDLRAGLAAGRPYLLVGYVHPEGYTGAQTGLAGVYDGLTGQRVTLVGGVAQDFRWAPGVAQTLHRAYLFYASSGAVQRFWAPRLDLCNGYEPTVAELLAPVARSAALNFNARNDRDGAALLAPTIAADGTAVDHTLRADGAADVSLEWAWAGDAAAIDGWLVYLRQGDDGSAYTVGSLPSQEQAYSLPADKRACIFMGLAADKYYTLGVQAYRVVDPDVNPAGVIKSAIVQPSLAAEAPYRPATQVAFAGNVSGTVGGLPVALVNVWSAVTGSGKPADGATADITLVARGAVALRGNVATKDAGAAAAWDADVYSREGFTGGAYAVAVPGTSDTYAMFGLNSDPASATDYQSIDFAMYAAGGGTLYRFESAALGDIIGSWVAGDVLAVVYDGTTVRYLKNGTVLATNSAVAPGLTLHLDSSFYNPGSQLAQLRCGPMTSNAWASIAGTGKPSDYASADIELAVRGTGLVLVGGNACSRPSGGGGWDSDCYSLSAFTGGAYCEFVPSAGTLSHFMAGLNDDPLASTDYTTISYAFYMGGTADLQVYENGTARGSVGTYAAGDVLAVVYDGERVLYLQNGVVVREVAAAAGQRLYFDSSIVYHGLRNIRFGPVSSIAGKVTTFVQATPPAIGRQGDLWFDSDAGNRPYRHNGSAWVEVADARVADALLAAAGAQATADGKIESFYQPAAPAVAQLGDLWFDTDDGNRLRRWNGAAWADVDDARIAAALSDAADAQATADGKVVTFVQGTEPVAEAVGDLWLNSAAGNSLARWSGSAWEVLAMGTDALLPNAATEIFKASSEPELSFSTIS